MLVVLVSDGGSPARLLQNLVDVLGVEVVLAGRELTIQGLHDHVWEGQLALVLAEGTILDGRHRTATNQLREAGVVELLGLLPLEELIVGGQLVAAHIILNLYIIFVNNLNGLGWYG